MKEHKNLSFTVSGMAVVLSCILLFSCNDEDFFESNNTGKACDHICFGISPAGNARTRGSVADEKEGYTSARFVLRAENSADTLCVRAIVSDGIRSSARKDKQVVTRGAPVTKEAFYNSFHVSAYWTKGETLVDQFYMDEEVTDDGSNIWSGNHTYYWPGAAHELQFYAWAPADAFTGTPATPASKTLSYTVPDEATAQKDLVVATTAALSGDHNAAVPLSFQHICTAVRFVVGSEMQAGIIKSVGLRGVYYEGTYDMSNSAWALDEQTTYFGQQLNQTTDGTENDGDVITSSDGTFMMLPQTLPESAVVEVQFQSDLTGETRMLTASIAGMTWEMGKTVTYKLSISPEFDLYFLSEPEAQDAHYVIYPITIKAESVPKGWTLTSNAPDDVTFVETFPAEGIKNLVDQQYWLKEYCGTPTLTSTSSGDVKVYVFVRENIADQDRDIVLSLAPMGKSTQSATFTFKQYCPAWNTDIGVERIQEKDYPWGFNWDANMKITYVMPAGDITAIRQLLFAIFGNHTYVTSSGWSGWPTYGDWKLTIDFSKVPKLETATNTTNGLRNTWELFTFDGLNEASTIMDQMVRWGGSVEGEGLPVNPAEYAAWACAKKNPFKVNTKSDGAETIYAPVLEQSDLVWYLPAQYEAPQMNDAEYPLAGNYWTSTAITDPGTTAFKYTAGGSATSDELRNNSIHVRAVRKKQP